MHQPHPLKTFIIYAREDSSVLVELKKSLNLLERKGQIAVWYDGEIIAGQEWEKAIKIHLETADIILLMLSSDFFDSEYIEKKELREALARHGRGESVVIPVVVRHCLWQEHPEIEKLQVLPDNATPISSKRHWDSPDEAFTNVAAGIARTVRDLREQRDKHIHEAAEAEARRHAAEKAAADLAARRARDPFFEDMVLVEGGSFQMGSNKYDDEKPIHTVMVPSFYISKYPVTQGQWQKVMGNNPSHFKGDERLPVEFVSWDDVQAFLKKLNEQTGERYRLPSEAEWEYAARGGQKSIGYEYAGSNTLDEVGWYWENSGDKRLSGDWDFDKIQKNNCRSHPVGQKKANEMGLHDMSGNVWEWCEDDWHGNYGDAPKNGSAWVDDPRGSARVIRGGGWSNVPQRCRAAYRHGNAPPDRDYNLGFRLARSF